MNSTSLSKEKKVILVGGGVGVGGQGEVWGGAGAILCQLLSAI